MNRQESVQIARVAIAKRWDFETIKYSDELYGREYEAEDVWEYVEQHDRIGSIAFDNIYGDQ